MEYRDVKKEIVQRRRERIEVEGPALGHHVPRERKVPLVPFTREPLIICEIKRRSPSKGDINSELKALEQAALYVSEGIQSISVLTEEDYFQGSLQDLMEVKEAYPQVSVLRKDFLFLPEDIDLSYRAGADAVLLIASILDLETLKDLYTRAQTLGMDVLFEIHSWEDAQKASKIKPDLTGINSRNLRTFQTDPLLPMKTRSWVDYPTTLVYESGILRSQDALFAGENGFHGILVGEGVVRRPQLVAELRRDFKGLQGVGFWAKLFTHWVTEKVLVKFCGFTRVQDVLAADKLGVDLLGFILAPSKRQVTVDFIRSLPKTRAQKVGVLVLDAGSKVPQEILELLGDGALDALQLHGKEDPQLLDDPGLFAYKALSLGKGSDDQVSVYEKTLAPRVLFDAYSPDERGGTGLSIDPQFLEPYIHQPLWLAGGLTPQNILTVKKDYPVELVDVSSGIESEPGIKDLEKMKAFLRELRHGE